MNGQSFGISLIDDIIRGRNPLVDNMGKVLESIIGGLFVTTAVFADFLQLTHPYNLSSWLLEFGHSSNVGHRFCWMCILADRNSRKRSNKSA